MFTCCDPAVSKPLPAEDLRGQMAFTAVLLATAVQLSIASATLHRYAGKDMIDWALQ